MTVWDQLNPGGAAQAQAKCQEKKSMVFYGSSAFRVFLFTDTMEIK